MGFRKGFIIHGDDGYFEATGLKQRINLSESAHLTIESDIKDFGNGVKANHAGFYNRIFENFYQEADATISHKLVNKCAELEEMFSSPEFKSVDEVTKKLFIDKMLSVYQRQLEEKATSYEKGVISSPRLDKGTLSILRQSTDSEYYQNSIPQYLKAIFEEYALKSMYERERIYFKKTIDTIQSAISQKKALKITILKKYNTKTRQTYTKMFMLFPYKIVQDKFKMYNYVIGYSEELDQEGSKPKKIASYRISRIEDCRLMSSISGFLSKDDKNAIEKEVIRKEVQFLAGEVETIKVKFTKKGVENLNSQLYMRPNDFKKVEDEENTYIFNCTEVQAINYFLKFVRDVEILEPKEIREKFVSRYRDAYMQYITQDDPEIKINSEENGV